MMDGVYYRKTTLKDLAGVTKLIRENFGYPENWNLHSPYEAFKGRYLIAVDSKTNEIVAVTGMNSYDEAAWFNGYEISWTCCDTRYRGHGIVTEMMRIVIKEAFENDPKIPVYCSCWTGRVGGETGEINLKHAMNELGFKEVRLIRIYDSEFNTLCKRHCVNFRKGKPCSCREVLYKLERQDFNG